MNLGISLDRGGAREVEPAYARSQASTKRSLLTTQPASDGKPDRFATVTRGGGFPGGCRAAPFNTASAVHSLAGGERTLSGALHKVYDATALADELEGAKAKRARDFVARESHEFTRMKTERPRALPAQLFDSCV